MSRQFRLWPAVLLAALLSAPLVQGAEQSSAGPQAKTKEEHDAYVEFYQEGNPEKKLALGNAFIYKYATSEFKPNVFLLIVQSQQNAKDSKKVVEWGERFLNDFPNHGSRPFVLQALMTGYQDLNDFPHTVEYAEKLLQADPANLTAVYTIPFILSERAVATEEEGRKRELARAVEIAQKGLAMAKPATLTEEQWAEFQATLHSSLGLIHLNNKDYAQSQIEYGKAIAVINTDPILFFRAGLSYSFDKKYDPAIDLLSKSVYLKGITEIQARTELERVYRIKHGVTTIGPELQAALEELIKTAGSKLK
jgi:tetratricopeptide (TPR) repeat protein